MSLKRYLAAAHSIALAIPEVLAEQGLDPCVCCYFLTETERGDVWLFAAMHETAFERLDSYSSSSLLSRISEAFHGHLVTYSQEGGLRYAVLLSPARNFYNESQPRGSYP